MLSHPSIVPRTSSISCYPQYSWPLVLLPNPPDKKARNQSSWWLASWISAPLTPIHGTPKLLARAPLDAATRLWTNFRNLGGHEARCARQVLWICFSRRGTSLSLPPPFTRWKLITETPWLSTVPLADGGFNCVFSGSESSRANMGAITYKFDARISFLREGIFALFLVVVTKIHGKHMHFMTRVMKIAAEHDKKGSKSWFCDEHEIRAEFVLLLGHEKTLALELILRFKQAFSHLVHVCFLFVFVLTRESSMLFLFWSARDLWFLLLGMGIHRVFPHFGLREMSVRCDLTWGALRCSRVWRTSQIAAHQFFPTLRASHLFWMCPRFQNQCPKERPTQRQIPTFSACMIGQRRRMAKSVCFTCFVFHFVKWDAAAEPPHNTAHCTANTTHRTQRTAHRTQRTSHSTQRTQRTAHRTRRTSHSTHNRPAIASTVEATWFSHIALKVKVKKFEQPRLTEVTVTLKKKRSDMPRHLIGDAQGRSTEIPTVPIYQRNHSHGDGLVTISGDRRPCWS